MLSEEQLREIEEAEKKATTGPWYGYERYVMANANDCDGSVFYLAMDGTRDDRNFIAGSRTWIPQLLDTIRELKEEREILFTDLEYWRSQAIVP